MRALVIEGGGSRAAHAHGVLAAFEDAGLTQFDAVYGTSAGGSLAAWFCAGQIEFAVDLWDHSRDGGYVSYLRWLTRRGPLFDQERVYREVYEPNLDVDAIRAADHPVVVTAADADTGRTVYHDIREGPTFQWLMATGRLPVGSGPPVEIDGLRLLDGGITDPIPIQRAIDDGADEVVALLNRPPTTRTPEPWVSRLVVGRKFPALKGAWDRHHELHNDAVALALDPPDGVTVHVIRPDEPTGVGRMTDDHARILRAVRIGEAAGYRFLRDRRPALAPERPEGALM